MKINNLNKVYKTKYETVHALDDVNLILPPSGLVFIVGVSGSGKTTLMNMLSGVDKPSTGDVIIGDKSLYKNSRNEMFGYRNSYVGLVFQDYNLIEDLNVYDNIKLTLELMGKTNFEIVDKVIKQVDIEDIKYSAVNEISSGQMQRVAIARALVKDSSMILADEPTGNLDSKNETIVFDLLKEISQDRLVIIITHDEEAAIKYGDRIIEIEDGKIIEDTKPIAKDTSETPPQFISPKINLSQQIRFTSGFIKNNLGRSLSIMLMLLLVPIIGGILSSYVFFDVSVSYRNHQELYDSKYITLSKPVDGFDLYYAPNDFTDLIENYPGSRIIELHDTNIDINPTNKQASYFYRPEINNIIIYNHAFEIDGRIPREKNEIVITDYVLASIEHYQGKVGVSKLMIEDIEYDIVGVVRTDFQKFNGRDFTDPYNRMAFEENLRVFNAIFTSIEGFLNIRDTQTSYRELVRYVVYAGKSIPETKFDEITVSQNEYIGLGRHEVWVSSAFLREGLELDFSDVQSHPRLILHAYSRTRYRITPRITNYFESDKYEIIVHPDAYDDYINKMEYSRVLILRDDVNYSQIVKNENVINESFYYAQNMWDKAADARIIMIEFLIVLIVIVIVFSSIINSMTIATEKKKIGIKYSFGMKKIPIIIPYVFEYLFYIIIGFVVSTLIVMWGFPYIMQNIIYTKTLDIMAFDFFYISWNTIIGWDSLIYALMFISLFVMIFNICKRSPIEIIKDL